MALVDQSGDQVCVNGVRDAVAPATIQLAGRESVAGLQVSVTRVAGFARRVRRLVGAPPTQPAQWTGPGLAVCIDNRLRYASVEGVGGCPLPQRATIEGPQGQDLLVRTFRATGGFGSERVVLSMLTGPDDLREGARPGGSDTDRVLVAGILLGFFVLALIFALAVSRQLQGQVAGLLEAVRRLGRGDFSTRAPTDGGDEFAELGAEFNKMSDQLAAQLDEVTRERERVLAAVRRLGAAMGSSLHRDRLLEIVVTTAVEGLGAHGGRVSIRRTGDAPMEQAARAGNLRLEAVLRDAEDRVLGSGDSAEAALGATHALAHPLMMREGDESHMHGVISVARAGDPFSDAQRELLGDLVGQAELALENLHLHEALAREAVTDGLTGLSNRRRFNDAVGLEIEHWRRTGERVGLIMLDIDDFKAVNDTQGWLQGDEVLREVARVLHAGSRRNDEAARYGGEELAIVLAGASLDEAYIIAERVRAQIEELKVRPLDGKDPVRVTVSAGVSSVPECARDEHSLVATAFGALQRAKCGGKNRTVRAPRLS